MTACVYIYIYFFFFAVDFQKHLSSLVERMRGPCVNLVAG